MPLKRIFSTTRNFAELAHMYRPPVHRCFVTLEVTYSTELHFAPTAYAAFLLFPGFRLLLLSHPRPALARGWRGAFLLRLVDLHRRTHIILFALTTRLPVCCTTFALCFTGSQEFNRCGDEALAHRGCAGLQVACFIVRLRDEHFLKILMVVAEEFVERDLCDHNASDVVSTQTIVQLTVGGDVRASWVSLSCNQLPQNMSSEYDRKSFS